MRLFCLMCIIIIIIIIINLGLSARWNLLSNLMENLYSEIMVDDSVKYIQ